MAKKPGFTIAAIARLALGIGANTATFTVLDGVLIWPLIAARSGVRTRSRTGRDSERTPVAAGFAADLHILGNKYVLEMFRIPSSALCPGALVFPKTGSFAALGGHILLDGGLPETVPRIEKNIAALGFHMSDMKALLNSHAHFDHAGGLAALKTSSTRAYGCKPRSALSCSPPHSCRNASIGSTRIARRAGK